MSMRNEDNFFERVYQIARQIPEGRVTPYGAIARALGSAGSSRMVGYAMRAAYRASPPVPAHRLVNRIGFLIGKRAFGHPALLQQLLENEGITIVDDQVVDFDMVFWDPKRDTENP